MAGSEPTPSLYTGTGLAPGMAGLWSTVLATAVLLLMLGVLLVLVGVNAFAWFWPARLLEVRHADGSVLVGEHADREEIPGSGEGRVKLKVGNRELDGRDFVWVDEASISSRDAPPDLVRVIRSEYGDAFGRIVSATAPGGAVVPVTTDDLERLLAEGARLRKQRGELLAETGRVRRPLTRLEEELDQRQRSAAGKSEAGRLRVAELARRTEALAAELEPSLAKLDGRLEELDASSAGAGLELDAGGRRFTVPLGNVLEVVWSNRLGTAARVGWALRHGVLFLLTEPREANTEGGIFPALFGTVLLVLIMSVAVVPLGVMTAVYMTEYARQGVLLRLAEGAVTNLAGVPSIVFGMFGLAFFLYGVGGTVDRLVYPERLPTPTFGTGGILWAALTLSLLTVPVVVVATREGLLAVPKSWREGALALGATQWQTLRRIVLPAATPGILTGLILAVSRAAGEVAPLMLTGAAKLAPSLPLDAQWPFLHLERKFMHLGFHIYDVSMQSPNVEAAKPMAFATTAVLLLLVVVMNASAIVLRRKLRRAYRGQVV